MGNAEGNPFRSHTEDNDAAHIFIGCCANRVMPDNLDEIPPVATSSTSLIGDQADSLTEGWGESDLGFTDDVILSNLKLHDVHRPQSVIRTKRCWFNPS